MSFFRSKPGLVRFIMISLERSAGNLIASLQQRLESQESTESALNKITQQMQASTISDTQQSASSFVSDVTESALSKISQQLEPTEFSALPSNCDSIDPYELLELIQKSTKNTISVEDFSPVSIAMVLEPLLSVINYGNYYMRPSPYCGFVACLINHGEFKSVPLNRIFNLSKFFFRNVPYCICRR